MKLLKNVIYIGLTSLLIVVSIQAKVTQYKQFIPKVDVYVVPKATNLSVILQYPATITDIKSAVIVSRVQGILQKKYFIAGQKVKKNEVVYKIEDSTYKAKVNAMQASVDLAQAIFNNAIQNWTRTKKLYKSKSISQQKRDNSFASYMQAKASLGVAKANLSEAQINLKYTNVKAPISGIIGLKMINVGNLVTTNPSTPLVKITQNNKVYINFSMPMSDYIKFKNHIYFPLQNKKIEISIKVHHKIIKKKGFIDFIDTNIDPRTSTVKMRAIIDNSNHYLMAGEFVQIILDNIIEKNIITIPQKAVLQNSFGTIVFIVSHGHVKVRPILINGISGNNFIIKNHTLKISDKVIIDNFFKLKPGQAVIVDRIINK